MALRTLWIFMLVACLSALDFSGAQLKAGSLSSTPQTPVISSSLKWRHKASLTAHLKASDGLWVDSKDLGVQSCELNLDGSAFDVLEGVYEDKLLLRIYIKYSYFNSVATFKAFASVEPLGPIRKQRQEHDVRFDPMLLFFTKDNRTAFPLLGKLTFPIVPSATAATFPLSAEIELGDTDSQPHEYWITSFAANSSCLIRPVLSPNVLDHRGVGIPSDKDAAQAPEEAYIVMSPFYNVQNVQHLGKVDQFALLNISKFTLLNINKFGMLLDRHIQWHTSLGFSRYIVYMRAIDITDFTAQPAISDWIAKGVLIIVLWESIPAHPTLSLYDQRIVYSHAMLAFTGIHSYVVMADLDEYIMSMRNDLKTFQEMVVECTSHEREDDTTDMPVNLQMPRYNSLAKGFHRLAPEVDMWLTQEGEVAHPLLRYSLVNRARPPANKSVVRPEFIHTYFTHYASQYIGYKSSVPAPKCLFVLHLKSIFRKRDAADSSGSALRLLGFEEDAELEAALKLRGSRLYQQPVAAVQSEE